MHLSRKLAVGALCVAIMLAFDPAATAGKTCWDYTRAERKLAHKVNRARGRNGLARVSLDRHLSKVSRYHTNEMIRARSVYHTPLTKLGNRVTRWIFLAENIGRAGKVSRVFRLMMRSSLHRSNILKAGIKHLGVGVKRKRGNAWVTITFEARRDPGTRLSMPKC